MDKDTTEENNRVVEMSLSTVNELPEQQKDEQKELANTGLYSNSKDKTVVKML